MEPFEESVALEKPRPSWWRRWLKRLGKLLLLALIAITIRQAWHHHEVKKKLQEFLEAMDRKDPGWRLQDIEAAREQIPEEDNSARVVVAAAKLLPKEWPPSELANQLGQRTPEEQLAPDELARLEQELDNVQPALNEARKLVAMPRGRHHLDYKPFVLDTMLSDQQDSRRVVRLLCYDALRHSQERDPISALKSCRAAFHGAISIGDEPFTISQVIRSANVILSCQAIEQTLAQGELPLAELVDCQTRLRNEDSFPDERVVAWGGRAMMHELFAAVERGDVPLTDSFFDSRPIWEEYVYGWFTREKFREAHPRVLLHMNRFLIIAEFPFYKQAGVNQSLRANLHEDKEYNPLAVLFIPALDQVFDLSRRKHAYLRCTITTLAVERYRRAQNKWPDSLDTLCPEFLDAVPLDTWVGEPLRYRRSKDGVVIYSVGSDRTDDNGHLDPAHPNQSGVDIGIRLWDVAKRRQPPRLKPRQEQKPQ